MHKIGSLLSKSGLAIQFLFKFWFRNYDQNVKIESDLRVQVSLLAKVVSIAVADLVLCGVSYTTTILSSIVDRKVMNGQTRTIAKKYPMLTCCHDQ